MPNTAEKIEALIEKRKGRWTRDFREDPARAAELLREHGAPDLAETLIQGAVQGASHGFADDIERATSKPDAHGKREAKNQIRAQAANPAAYMLANILGTAGTGILLRGGGAGVGKVRSANVRRGQMSQGAGGSGRAAQAAQRASEIEDAWAQFPVPKKIGSVNVSLAARGVTLDAAHGGAWGYGGTDVSKDEAALDLERMKRAGIGMALGTLGGPVSTSAAAWSANLPLLWGGRRAFSQKMLEPPGVTRKTPQGRPHEALDIARTRDESAARAAGGQGLVRRDKARPIDSEGANVREVADAALEPVARGKIDELRTAEREAAASGMFKDYPGYEPIRLRRANEQVFDIARPIYHGTGREFDELSNDPAIIRPVTNENDARMAHFFTAEPEVAHAYRKQASALEGAPKVRKLVDKFGAAIDRSFDEDRPVSSAIAKMHANVLDKRIDRLIKKHGGGGRVVEAYSRLSNPKIVDNVRHYDEGVFARHIEEAKAAGHDGVIFRQVRDGSEKPADVFAIFDPKSVRDAADDFEPQNAASRKLIHPSQGGQFVNDMMEAVARQDAPALNSWISTVQQAARRDPAITPRVQRAVAKQLAINERSNPALNDTPFMRELLHGLGMAGNKAKGTANVLEAARAGPREQYRSDRYSQALERRRGQPQMRARHAAAMRDALEKYQAPAYPGPALAARGPALHLRGDDRADFLMPWDFYREGRVNNAQVNAAGALSGPIAMMGEKAYTEAFTPPGEWREPGRPAPPVIEGEFQEKTPATAAAPPPGLLQQLAPPPPPGNPVLEAAQQAPAQPQQAPMDLRSAQQLLAGVAGLPLERFGADGRMGPETQAALVAFQQAAQVPVTGQLDELTARRLAQLRDGALPPAMIAQIRAALSNDNMPGGR